MFPNARRMDSNAPAVPAAPAANTATPTLTVESMDNHVYFYSEVNSDRCLDLIRKLREVDRMLRVERASRNLPDGFPQTPIWLHIESPGGGLFTGFNVADQIKSISTPVYSVIEGFCASAATFISMACTKRFIRPASFMLVHQFTAFTWGTYEQFKDDMKLYDLAIEKMARFYVERTRLSYDQVREMLKHDYWMDAVEALKSGFVDEIM